MSDQNTWFIKELHGKIPQGMPADDYLHPQVNAEVLDEASTETQGHLFSVPEAGITCMGYIWHHPRLNLLTGGCMAWQGKKTFMLGCELLDMRSFMHDRALANDIGDYQLVTGYRAQVLEPNQRFRMSYEDAARGNAFDVELNAIMPLAMATNGRHFEQAMRAKGWITLRGQRYAVDSYSIRDRTWGEARSEAIVPTPPIGWLNGIFGDDFAFSCTVIDHPELEPIWKAQFKIPAEKTLLSGWVWRDGEIVAITGARKKTHYDTRTLIPQRVDFAFTDARGRAYEATATAVNAAPTNTWMNLHAPVFLARWECNGRQGWGESQDIQWNDFVQAHLQA